jgi:hypothetical protein
MLTITPHSVAFLPFFAKLSSRKRKPFLGEIPGWPSRRFLLVKLMVLEVKITSTKTVQKLSTPFGSLAEAGPKGKDGATVP